MLGLVLATGLILSACSAQRGTVTIIDDDGHGADGAAAYAPVGRSGSPRVHPDGAHTPAEDVQIGPSVDDHAAPYVPVARAGSMLLVPGGEYTVAAPVLIGLERQPDDARTERRSAPASTPTAVVSRASAKPGTAPRAAASPTTPARLHLGPGLGASASGAAPADDMLVMTDEDEEMGSVSGRIESISGSTMLVRTETGQEAHVPLQPGARIDRDTPGTAADLKPGQFVGVLQRPSGPAVSVRLYDTNPAMPPPGMVPMVGSRIGQVTTFGTIVSLQFGGLVLNIGSQTTPVAIPNEVEILKAARGTVADAGVGAQIIATGPLAADGSINATAIRVTAAAPRAVPAASPQPAPRRS